MLKVAFIYLVPLTGWVSNPVLVDKKQGMVCVCIDFRDLIRHVLKIISLHILLIRLSMTVWGMRFSPSLYDFSSYNKITIHPKDQHKTNFIYPRSTFAYKNMPFGLKNVGLTFQ